MKILISIMLIFVVGCSSSPSKEKNKTLITLKDYYYCLAENKCALGKNSSYSYDSGKGDFIKNNPNIIKEQLYQAYNKPPDMRIVNKVKIEKLFFGIQKIIKKNGFKIKHFKEDYSMILSQSEEKTIKKMGWFKWKGLYFLVVNIHIKPRDKDLIYITFIVDNMKKSPISQKYESNNNNRREIKMIVKRLINETTMLIDTGKLHDN